VLFVLVAYRLLSPGSEWRLHREWFDRSALADLLGSDDRLLAHKQAVFDHLVGRWRDLFNASFEVLLYDLTSTYFEADPPFPEGDKRRHGYSRDHRGETACRWSSPSSSRLTGCPWPMRCCQATLRQDDAERLSGTH
jgi:hypothetical protein